MFSFKKIIEFNLAHRWLVMGFFLLITALSATQLPKMRFDFSPEAMLEFGQEEIDYQKAFNEKFGVNPNLFLAVFASETPINDARTLQDLREVTDILQSVDKISGTYSLARVPDSTDAGAGALFRGSLPELIPKGELSQEDVERINGVVQKSAILRGNLISEDLHYALITANVAPEYSEPDKFFPVFRSAADKIEAWQKDGHSQYAIDYGGIPYIRAVTVDTMKRDQLMLWPVVGLLYIVALCIVFRSFWQAVLPLVCIGCVCLWAISVMVLIDMPVTMINNTLPMLILVIGVTNGMYIVLRILDERRKGKDKNHAIVDGVYRVALASLLTTSTTSIGFGSLLVAKTTILNGFGGITALAVMLIYVAIIFFMPQVASLVRLDPKTAADPDAEPAGAHDVPQTKFERLLDRFALFTIAHKKAVIVGALILLCLCLGLASQIRFNSKVNDVFQEKHPITMTNKIIEENLGGVLPVELDLVSQQENYFKDVSNLSRACRLQKSLKSVDGVISALSLCDLAAEGGIDWDNPPNQAQLTTLLLGIRRLQPEQYRSFITEAGDNIHISMRIPDDGFEVSKRTIARIEALAKAAYTGEAVNFRLTGIGYNSTLGLDHFMMDLFSSLLTAFVIIFAILFICFRSFWSGFVAILPNLLPLAMTLAFLPVYGYNLNTTTVLVFTISIGLAVDNSIHIIQRFRQEFRGDRSVEDAVRVAVRSSGRAVIQSNILLCSGLAVLLLSDFDPISRVGVLTITTIGAALVVSLILLPAEIACFGKRMQLEKYRAKKALPAAPEGALQEP